MIDEMHTSDMTNQCMYAVKLRHEGKIIGEMPSALYAGNLWHEAAPLYHLGGCVNNPSPIVYKASQIVRDKSKIENRPFTDAVERDITEHQEWCSRMLGLYDDRFGAYFRDCKLIGCEVPLRITIPFGEGHQDFATHTDMMFRDPNGRLALLDWKTGDDAPTNHYLSRNLQFFLMWLGVGEGSAKIGDDWIDFAEYPDMYWFHVDNLEPYKRAGSGKGPDGEPVSYVKGDKRPTDKIMYRVPMMEECRHNLMDELHTRISMNKLGMFPRNPDPVRCHLCSSNMFCPSGSYSGVK